MQKSVAEIKLNSVGKIFFGHVEDLRFTLEVTPKLIRNLEAQINEILRMRLRSCKNDEIKCFSMDRFEIPGGGNGFPCLLG